MPEYYFTVNLNLGRNSVRMIEDPVRRKAEARRHVKLFHAPPDGEGLISDGMVPDEFVSDSMIERYLEIWPPDFCIAPDFQKIVDEMERAYVLGLYFSAVSSACVMIERLVNLLRIELHRFHPDTQADLTGKGPTTNWKENIDALVEWGYLSDQDTITGDIRKLYFVRSKYLHAGPLDTIESDALEAIRAGYEMLKRFLGFPDHLFEITNQITWKDPTHPVFQAFYAPMIVVKEDS